MDVFSLQAVLGLDSSGYDSGLRSAKSAMESFGDKLKSTLSGASNIASTIAQGFEAVEGVGKAAQSGMTSALKGFAAASTAVAGFGATAVKAGMTFDSTMSEVAAISGATGADFDALRKKAIEMGAATQFSASEAAAAMTYMGMAGWKSGDMISGIAGIMNLAAASGEDLATTSDIVTDALTAFGKTASDSGRLADIMAAAATNANTDVGMMGDTFKYVAPVAGALGYEMEDTALAIGLMANAGIKSSQAGTSLRSILTRLSTDAGASSKSLGALGVLTEKLGVEFYNTDGSARELNDVLVDSRKAWAGLTEEQQINYAKTIAGQEGISAWLALMNAAPEDINKLTNAIYNCNGAAEEMANVRLDNLAGDITLLKSAFESLQIAISDSLTPTLREFAQFGQKAMKELITGFQSDGVSGFMSALQGIITDGIKMLAEKAPEFASVTIQFVEAMANGILGARMEIATAAIEIFDMLIDGVDSWLSQNGGELIAAGNQIIAILFSAFVKGGNIISKYIGDFIPLIARAFIDYHDVMFTVGLDILGAIGRGLVESKDSIQAMASQAISEMLYAILDNVPSIIDGGIALIEALVGAIMENASLIAETGVEIVSHLASSIGKALPDLIPAAFEAILAFAEGLVNPQSINSLMGAAIDILGGLVEGILKALPMLIEYGPEIVISLATGIISALPEFIQIGVQLIKGLIEGMIQAITALPAAIAKIVTAIIDAFKALFGIHSPSTVMMEIGAFLIAGLLEGISGGWQGIVDFFAGAAEALIAFLRGMWDSVKETASATWEGMKQVCATAWEGIKNVWSGAKEFFAGVWNGIQSIFSSAKEILSGFFAGALAAIKGDWGTAKEYFAGVWNDIKTVFASVKETLSNFFKEAWESIKGIWEGAKEFFAGIGAGIKEIFNDAKEAIGAAFREAWETARSAWEIAKQFFADIWNNIKDTCAAAVESVKQVFANTAEAVKSAWNGIKEFFAGIWTSIKNTFKDALSHFSDVGKNIVDGIKKGISGAWTALTTYVTGRFKALVDSVKSKLGIASPSKVFASIGGFMAEGLGVGWKDEFSDIQRMITDSLDFGTATVGVSANTSYTNGNGVNSTQTGFGGGNTWYININNPEKRDAVTEAREWNKTLQRMTLAYA